MNLPPLVPIADPRTGAPLPEQVRRLGHAGFPLVLLREGGTTWEDLERLLRRSQEAGGWPAVGVADAPDLVLRAAQEGHDLWSPETMATLPTTGPDLEHAEACYRGGAEALLVADGVKPSTGLLWRAQRLRWSVRPPFREGQGVALVGGSGCGKSTLARLLSVRLGLPVGDVDEVIAREAGKSIPRIFAEDGEPEFRRREVEATCRCFQAPAVLALGGGAWESEAIRLAAERSGYAVLWIAEHPGRVWNRIARDPGRPLAQERNVFLERWRSRMGHWREATAVLPLGRSAEVLAETLAASRQP